MSNNNLAELKRAEGLLADPEVQREQKLYVLIGALSQLVDAKTWAMALNTTYGYIREVEDAKIR